MGSFSSRLKHAFNVFMNRDPTNNIDYSLGLGSFLRPDRLTFSLNNQGTIVVPIYNRIAVDCAAQSIEHVKIDENNHYIETINSGLNRCLTLDANVDQTGRAFIQDIVMSLCDEGVVAIVPTETNDNYLKNKTLDILKLRVGKILDWYPKHVKLEVYNEISGIKEIITLPKDRVAIVENPFYSVMNDFNSVLKKLVQKMNLLDALEQSNSGKLDLIIQLPYVIKTEARKQQAEERRQDIENQLKGSRYGIAYTDGTEKITQLNRPAENTIFLQIEYFTKMLYAQLGFTENVLNGTATDKEMINYFNKTIEPIMSAIVLEMKRKFLTKTAITQRQSIEYYTNPFRMMQVSELSEIADKLTRNEILSSNEFRAILGYKPVDTPEANELRNKNLNRPLTSEETNQNSIDELESQLDDLDSLEEEISDEGLEDSEEIQHYASPYYDPVKAHEYYMKTRELKGRRSTAKLNDDGKAAVKNVKQNLDNEKKEKIKEMQEEFKSKTAELRKKVKAILQRRREEWKNNYGAKPGKKGKNGRKASAISQAFRDKFKKENKVITDKLKTEISSLRDSIKQEIKRLKGEYDEKYLTEIDNIKGSGEFNKVLKRKGRSRKRK